MIQAHRLASIVAAAVAALMMRKQTTVGNEAPQCQDESRRTSPGQRLSARRSESPRQVGKTVATTEFYRGAGTDGEVGGGVLRSDLLL